MEVNPSLDGLALECNIDLRLVCDGTNAAKSGSML